jgi:uncharacterized protein
VQLTVHTDGVSFPVRVAPRAKRNAVAGMTGDALKVAVQQPPEDGRANEAVIELLADWLNVKRRQVAIVTGATHRNKIVRVTGVSRAIIEDRLKSLGL